MSLAEYEYREAMRRFNGLLPIAQGVIARGGIYIGQAYLEELRRILAEATRWAKKGGVT